MRTDEAASEPARKVVWTRETGRCPLCHEPLVSNVYLEPGKGYLIVREHDPEAPEPHACSYRQVL